MSQRDSCPVCLTPQLQCKMFGLVCGHMFCSVCWAEYLTSRIHSGNANGKQLVVTKGEIDRQMDGLSFKYTHLRMCFPLHVYSVLPRISHMHTLLPPTLTWPHSLHLSCTHMHTLLPPSLPRSHGHLHLPSICPTLTWLPPPSIPPPSYMHRN